MTAYPKFKLNGMKLAQLSKLEQSVILALRKLQMSVAAYNNNPNSATVVYLCITSYGNLQQKTLMKTNIKHALDVNALFKMIHVYGYELTDNNKLNIRHLVSGYGLTAYFIISELTRYKALDKLLNNYGFDSIFNPAHADLVNLLQSVRKKGKLHEQCAINAANKLRIQWMRQVLKQIRAEIKKV